MPHYFLHQRNGDDSIEDYEGGEYRDLESAVEEAIKTARDTMADRVKHGIEPDGWRFEIVDKFGAILAVVPFRETISEDGHLPEDVEAKWYRSSDI